MDEYLNKNYKKALAELSIFKGAAKETGNPYYMLVLKFNNGYERRLFLNDDQKFALQNAFDLVDMGAPFEEQ